MPKKIFFHLIIYISFFIISRSLNAQTNYSKIKEGDILFQHLNCGPMCEAIEAVTQGIDGRKFAHCALVVNINDSLKVIEAIGNKVQLNSLTAFFARSGDTTSLKNIAIGRLKKKYQNLIRGATTFAEKQIGQPYDDEFLLDNGKWYCSELLYESFKEANNHKDFFLLFPMTYKLPGSNDYFPVWIDYYHNLNAPIPEGKPGINPGSISRSDKIEIIKTPILLK